MTIFLMLMWMVLFVVGVAAFRQHQDYKKKIDVMRWVDEREKYFSAIARQASQIRSLGAIEHVGQIDGIWNNRFGPNGPRTFLPSTTGLKQIALAMDILAEREGLMQQIRDGVVGAYNRLAEWERTHPMPDIGMPYDEPPRPQRMSEPQPEPKKKAVAFLDAPIYDPKPKELNR